MKKLFEIPDIETVSIISEAIAGDLPDTNVGNGSGFGFDEN